MEHNSWAMYATNTFARPIYLSSEQLTSETSAEHIPNSSSCKSTSFPQTLKQLSRQYHQLLRLQVQAQMKMKHESRDQYKDG